MAIPTFQTTVLQKDLLCEGIWEIVCQKPADFSYKPGQFILWQVPQGDKKVPRAYSLASHPTESDLRFVFKYEAGGVASEWVKQSLSTGDTFEFTGPFGVFCLPETLADSYVFAATSTGIAPIRGLLLELLSREYTGDIAITYGVRSEDVLFWQDEIASLAARLQAEFVPILSLPELSWTGKQGRVQVVLKEWQAKMKTSTVYACGNPAMTKEVKHWCRDELQMPKEQVHIEGFI